MQFRDLSTLALEVPLSSQIITLIAWLLVRTPNRFPKNRALYCLSMSLLWLTFTFTEAVAVDGDLRTSDWLGIL